MFFHIKPIILSIVLLAGYELAAYRYDMAIWILLLVLVSIIFGTHYIVGKWSTSLFPILFFLGSSALLFFVSGGMFLQTYIVLCAGAYYLILLSVYRISEYEKDETARRINFMMSLVVVFMWSASLIAVYLNRNIGYWIIMLALYIVVFFITRQMLRVAVMREGPSYWLYSFTIAYCMTVFSWGIFFLPFGYLTLAVLLLIFYYVLTSYAIQALKGELTKSSMIFDIIIFIFSVGFVLASARWSLVL